VSNESEKPIHVESHNQSGGITAYQVNIQPTDRQLSNATAKKIADYLKGIGSPTVQVNAIMGDGEAFRFAEQIKSFVGSEGFNVEGVNQALYTAPMKGITIDDSKKPYRITIVIGNR